MFNFSPEGHFHYHAAPNQPRRGKTIGILNRGRNGTFKNNSFRGLDVGIQDEGEGTVAEGNDFS